MNIKNPAPEEIQETVDLCIDNAGESASEEDWEEHTHLLEDAEVLMGSIQRRTEGAIK